MGGPRKKLPLKSAVAAFVCLLAMTLGACAPGAEIQQGLDSARRALDQRRYSDAELILNDLHAKNPGRSDVSLLLAEAELGLANLGILDLINRVLGQQDMDAEAGVDGYSDPANVNALINSPDSLINSYFFSWSCPGKPIADPKSNDKQGCLALRLMKAIPAFEEPRLIRARNLLKEAFPDRAQTSSDVNFLVAYVNLLSALSRVKLAIRPAYFTKVLASDLSTAKWGEIFSQLKNLRLEGLTFLDRARASYKKMKEFLGHIYGQPVIQVGEHTLVFGPSTDYSDFYDFALKLVYDQRREINAMIQTILVQKVQTSFARMQGVAIRAMKNRPVEQFKKEYPDVWDFYQGFVTSTPETWIGSVLDQSSAPLLDPNAPAPSVNWVEFVGDHPPHLFEELRAGILASWDQERDEPLHDALARASDRFLELTAITDAWSAWGEQFAEVDPTNDLVIWDLINLVAKNWKDVKPPQGLDGAKLIVWEDRFAGILSQELAELDGGKLLPALPPHYWSVVKSRELLDRTQT
ncbi:MAG: hypothetical protein ACXWPM_09385, partial [Bdellovibrionota bacterium]